MSQSKHAQQLRDLSSELAMAEERERHRLAADLHDRISQPLAAIKIQLSALRASSDTPAQKDDVNKILDQVNQTIQATRSLTFELSLPILYELGLEAAIEWLADQFSEQHILKIDITNDGQAKPLENHVRILVFQAVRELLTNVVKHAHADRVNITLEKQNSYFVIQVIDNGHGMGPTQDILKRESGGYGLFNIQIRIEGVGGAFEISSQTNGTSILLSVPISQTTEDS